MDRQSLSCFILISVACAALCKNDVRPRLIGGKDAAEGSAPWQASIRILGEHQCSGALLNENWVVTAAHCILKFGLGNVLVMLGTNDLKVGGTAFRINEMRIHPRYKQQNHKHDLALVKLNSSVDFDWNIRSVELPNNQTVDSCGKLRACPIANFTGWQSQQADEEQNYKLQILKLSLIALEDCRKVFPTVDDNNICTFNGPEVPEGLCYGDAGGPLVVDGDIIAIGSWGSPCARGHPDVHTRIYRHVQWIKSVIDDDDDEDYEEEEAK